MPSMVKDYEVLCTIGSGSYGTCKKIRRIRDGKVLVWKELDYTSASDVEKQMLVSEVNLLRELKHEHIVRYIDRIIDRKHSMLYLVMEYCEGGDLASYICRMRKESLQIDESFVWRVCYQLTLAINECHSRSKKDGKSVMHRDLKPANIFLDANLNVKLGDFGLARVLSHEASFAKTCVGTPLYMSPEQMSGTMYNEKSDIWSLGCLLYELCALHPPFIAGNQLELATKICAGRFPRIPSNYSDELHSLVATMLLVDLDKRPTIQCLLNNATLLQHVTKVPTGSANRQLSSAAEEDGSESSRLESLKKREDEVTAREEVLKKKQNELDSRQNDLDRKAEDLEARESNLAVKERLAEDRMSRAERMMQVYSEAKMKLFNKLPAPVRNATDAAHIHSSYNMSLTSPRHLLQSILWSSGDSTMSLSDRGSFSNTLRRSAQGFDHPEESVDHNDELENRLHAICLKHMIQLQSRLQEERLRSEEIEWRFNCYHEEQCKTLNRL